MTRSPECGLVGHVPITVAPVGRISEPRVLGGEWQGGAV
jgi:hypothetical protein